MTSKVIKYIAYAHPTSARADELGGSGYYISCNRMLETGYWSLPYVAQGSDVFESRNDHDLYRLLAETEGKFHRRYCVSYYDTNIAANIRDITNLL